MNAFNDYATEAAGIDKKPTDPMYKIEGMPQKGWVQTDEIDLGGPAQVCQWCDAKIIRYVCRVEHPDGLHAEVGRVCCSRMTGQDGEGIHAEFKERRADFTRKWKQSRSTHGNYTKRFKHPQTGQALFLCVFQKGGGYKVFIKDQDTEEKDWWNQTYPTLLAAKEALFFHFEQMRRHPDFQAEQAAENIQEPKTIEGAAVEKPAAPKVEPRPDGIIGRDFHELVADLHGFALPDWMRQPILTQLQVKRTARELRGALGELGIQECNVGGLRQSEWELVLAKRDEILARPGQPTWRNEPATDKQIGLIKKFGYQDLEWESLTKGLAADIIELNQHKMQPQAA